MLIPSIDLYNGKAVQWRQGKEAVLEREDVHELLERFSLFGEVAIIDLNAATGEGSNRALIEDLLRLRPCRVGGGIRDLDSALGYIKAGASKIILGTAAREDFVRQLPRDALVFAIDSRGDRLLREGWREETGERTEDLIERLAPHCSEFLYTQVEKEGMMAGLDRKRIRRILRMSPIPVTVAGGITTLADIRFLNRLGANQQIGMAIYTGALDLHECFLAGVDFAKSELIPTIVQDATRGEVLMLAYSSRESLRLALKERRGIYFSRSRFEIWRKGDTSGHTQELIRAEVDCDGDTLLFLVRQQGPACHLNRQRCFAATGRGFGLENLDATLARRQNDPPAQSYTAKLLGDQGLLHAKLREETEELIAAAGPSETRWEAADLLYFTLVAARAEGVSLSDIAAELRSRHGNS